MKKFFIIGLLVALPFFLFAAGAQEEGVETPKTVRVLTLENGIFRAHDNYIEEFEKEYNINVEIEYVPERAMVPKMLLALSSGSKDYDVVAASNKTIGQIDSGDWCVDLNDFVKDPELSGSEFDFNDFLSGNIEMLTTPDGELLGIPYSAETNILYYNKEMFEDAGLKKAPETLKELEEYAAKLHKPEKDQYGIALRAAREGATSSYTWIFMWLAYGGGWHMNGRDYDVLDTPEAIESAEYWVNLLSNYGPPGINSYGWNEVVLNFQQGNIAMMMEGSLFGPEVEDPDQSKVAGKVGYSSVAKEGAENSKTVGVTWGWFMPKEAENKEAAWEFIKWSTGKELMTQMVEDKIRGDVTRESVYNSTEFAEAFNADWGAATLESINRSYNEYSPAIPQGMEIREQVSIALSKALSGQMPVKEAMLEANEKVKDILDK